MRRFILFLLLMIFPLLNVFAAPSNTMSITAPVDATVISASDETTRYNEITTKYNAHSHTDTSSSTANTFTIGDNAVGNKTYAVSTDDANDPAIRYNTTSDIWTVSDDGATYSTHSLVTGTVTVDNAHKGAIWYWNGSDTAVLEPGTSGYFLKTQGVDANPVWTQALPSSTTDNAVARYDGAAGALQNSGVIVDDSNNITGIGNLATTGTLTANDASNATCVYIDNDGTGNGMQIDVDGVLATNKRGLLIQSSAALTNSGTHLLRLNMDSASSTTSVMFISNSGSGKVIDTDAGAGTPAYLSVNGIWVNASSMYADKTNISQLDIKGFMDKIRTLKLFNYQKKYDVYGTEKKVIDGEEKKVYSETIKNPNARIYKGFILDDPTTPDELITRDNDGNIAGIDTSLGVNFLLAVCKEMTSKIDELEARIAVLEKR